MASSPHSPSRVKLFLPGFIFILINIFLPSLSLAAPANSSVAAKAGKDSPVVVTARSLFADNKKKIVIYTKDVVVKKDDMTMYADEVTVYLKEDGKAKKPQAGQAETFQGSSKIDTIVAKGRVKIIQQDKVATGDVATYYSDDDKVVLTGKQPRVWQGENVLNGSKITYHINEDTFEAEDADTVLYQKKGAPAPPATGGTK